MIDTRKIVEVSVEDVFMSDWPDLSDAYISDACYSDRMFTENELEELNDDRDFVYAKAVEVLF